MREIASAGYHGAPDPISLHCPANDVVSWFGDYGLGPAPPYYSAVWWDPAEEQGILGAAASIATYVRDLGCAELYVAAAGAKHVTVSGKTRRELAGQVSAAEAMTEEQFAQFAMVVGAFADVTLAEGVTSCLHTYVGTVIETASELAMLLRRITTDALQLGLDTGHIAWAGDDAAEVCPHYLNRIRTLHLKDVNGAIREQGVAADWNYRQFTEAGVDRRFPGDPDPAARFRVRWLADRRNRHNNENDSARQRHDQPQLSPNTGL
jgi:inosose dehydratase